MLIVSCQIVAKAPRRTYPYKPRVCIYCGATAYSKQDPTHAMGEEHIVARNLDGNLILDEASCQACERITSGLETHCAENIFGSARPHLGFTGRKSGKVRKTIKTGIGEDKTISMLLEDHPGHLFSFDIPPPGIILGLKPDPAGGFAGGQVVVHPVVPNVGERLDRAQKYGPRLRIGTNMNAAIFMRMLAKIAHAYAVAELTSDGFAPCLNRIIIGDAPSEQLQHFVGGALMKDQPISPLHELRLLTEASIDGQTYYVVQIRLFANRDGLPTFRVVAGTPLAPTVPPKPEGAVGAPP